MTTPATSGAGQDAAPLNPKLTAKQALARLLELIRSSRYLSDFTPERMSQVMGVEFVTYRPGYHAFGEQVTLDWWYSLEKDESDQYGPHFTLRFTPEDAENVDQFSVADICQLDFDKFSNELVTMGFTREPHYDSAPPPPFGEKQLPHGQLMYYSFNRIRDSVSEMTIQVYLRGGADDPQGNVIRDCVEMIRIY